MHPVAIDVDRDIGVRDRDVEDLRLAMAPLLAGLAGAIDRREATAGPTDGSLGRVVLEIEDPALQKVPWEALLRIDEGLPSPILSAFAVVRRIPARWRDQAQPYTLPLRFVQFRDGQRWSLGNLLGSAMGVDLARAEASVRVEELWIQELEAFRRDSRWPAAHVLHFSALPDSGGLDVLSTSVPEQAGTLGWLGRLVDTWQTRLVLIETSSTEEAARATSIAYGIANRGGPAVLITGEGARGMLEFYRGILNDTPVDTAVATSRLQAVAVLDDGRAEGLRISAVTAQIEEVGTTLRQLEAAPGPLIVGPGAGWREVGIPTVETVRVVRGNWVVTPSTVHSMEVGQYLRNMLAVDQPVGGLHLARTAFETAVGRWWSDEEHSMENPNLLTVGPAIERLRSDVKLDVPAERPAGPEASRYVTPTLLGAAQQPIPQRHALRADVPIQLAVQIGPRSQRVQVIGARGILEEVFTWTPDMAGTWIEVGVTGIDFDVTGDPVQELWLPQTGPSDEAIFTVVPRHSPVSILRFCLYYRNDVLQSFRLAASVRGSGRRVGRAHSPRGRRLAEALGVTGTEVAPGWAGRLEYGLDAAINPDRARPRRLSIVANDIAGRSIITVKGSDIFSTVDIDADLPDYVSAVRTAMDPKPDDDAYPYSEPVPDDVLKATFHRLATSGWRLFSHVISAEGRGKLRPALAEDGATIAVAQIVTDKVIPWAAIYDRKYDENTVDDHGNPAAFELCTAAFPAADGTPSQARCAVDDSCVLHPLRLREREVRGEPELTEKTVACPRSFWGFRHMIELPAQQTDAEGQVRPMPLHVRAGQKPIGSIAFNASIDDVSGHITSIDKVLSTGSFQVLPALSSREPILQQLANPNLDVVYVFCHAFDADVTSASPYLEFQAVPRARIAPEDLDAEPPWGHNPFVLLNACKTGAFSQKAISPFVKRLMRDRHAGGVLATEISVWIPLARRAGELFLSEFVGGKTSGAALLAMRRLLLAERNPMGLAYTVYGSADLAIERGP